MVAVLCGCMSTLAQFLDILNVNRGSSVSLERDM